MVEQVEIENFKSIRKLKIGLAGLNVFIGANGSGKSNILEGILLGAAAAADKLDNDLLSLRGMRLSDKALMVSAFDTDHSSEVKIGFVTKDDRTVFKLSVGDGAFLKWKKESSKDIVLHTYMKDYLKAIGKEFGEEHLDKFSEYVTKTREKLYEPISALKDFFIYSPENNELRKFEEEGQTQPLGVHGAGLFKLLKTMDDEQLAVLKKNLKMIDWFKDFKVSEDPSTNQRRIQLEDRYIAEENQNFFDQRNANEGFLFLLFYMSLFVSQYTPKFFAIDNIDNALNPRLCRDLMLRFNTLSKEYGKQAIVTTHNPAILDGLNLRDDNQRLYVVFRDLEGATKIKRVTEKMYNYDGDLLLSEAFSRGLIGGLNTSMAVW